MKIPFGHNLENRLVVKLFFKSIFFLFSNNVYSSTIPLL